MSKSPLFMRLNEILESGNKQMQDAPWENPEFYANWLVQTTYYCRHTTRLLALCGALTPIEQQPMHNRFLKHAAEEKGHENLTLLDIKNMGKEFADYPEASATQSFYQTQYYWIEHVHPYAFFGYILYLEAYAAKYGQAITARIQKAHGDKATNFMRVHSEEDVDHVEKALEQVEKFPPAILKDIISNMEQANANYLQMLQHCVDGVAKKKQKSAA